MFHLCDRVNGWSELSVSLTRSHLNKKADFGKMEMWNSQGFYLSNLPEERHVGFNSWLRVFVGSDVTCWSDAFQYCSFWLHRRWLLFKSNSQQWVASMLEKPNTLKVQRAAHLASIVWGCWLLTSLTVPSAIAHQHSGEKSNDWCGSTAIVWGCWLLTSRTIRTSRSLPVQCYAQSHKHIAAPCLSVIWLPRQGTEWDWEPPIGGYKT